MNLKLFLSYFIFTLTGVLRLFINKNEKNMCSFSIAIFEQTVVCHSGYCCLADCRGTPFSTLQLQFFEQQ
jgi:hypothetical protein